MTSAEGGERPLSGPDQGYLTGPGPDPTAQEGDALLLALGDVADRPEEHPEPYRTLSVVGVALALALVPVLSVLGHNRLAVLWLAAEVMVLALVRLRRPDGTWIDARGRVFDIVVGVLAALAMCALSYYAVLPRVL